LNSRDTVATIQKERIVEKVVLKSHIDDLYDEIELLIEEKNKNIG